MTRSVLAFPHEAERAGGLRGMEHLAARDASGRSQDYAYMPSALREKSRKVTFGNSVLMICCPLPLFRVYEAAAAAVWPAVLLYIHSHTLYISVDAIRRGKNQEQRSFNSSDLIYTTTSRGTINLYVRVSTRIHFIRTSRSTKLRVLLVSCLLYTSPSPRDQRGARMPSSA